MIRLLTRNNLEVWRFCAQISLRIPCTLEKRVVVNHFGTVLTNRLFSLPREGFRRIGGEDYSFSGLPECMLADYMKTHPPKQKEAER